VSFRRAVRIFIIILSRQIAESSRPCWALSQLPFCRAESNRTAPAGPPDHQYLAQVKNAWQDLPVIILIYLQRSGR
jgi:hypothetical protein